MRIELRVSGLILRFMLFRVVLGFMVLGLVLKVSGFRVGFMALMLDAGLMALGLWS